MSKEFNEDYIEQDTNPVNRCVHCAGHLDTDGDTIPRQCTGDCGESPESFDRYEYNHPLDFS